METGTALLIVDIQNDIPLNAKIKVSITKQQASPIVSPKRLINEMNLYFARLRNAILK